MSERPDVLVIGGGFYGLYLAEYLAGRFDHVILCEARSDLMQRASYANQARVHAGYHYPRSLLTAARSRANFPRFVDDFRAAIDRSFDQLYAISLRLTKVSAEQFRRSMHRIGAVLRPALPAARQMFDRGTIEDVFRTQEHAFNALVLKQLMRERAEQAGVEIRTHTPVFRLRQAAGETVEVELGAPHGPAILHARHVFCCVYSQVNAMLLASGLELIPLKHELAELALVALPKSLAALGITVMDGPFFSCMPFPALGLHTLSHVRYTPHFHWYDSPTACSSAAALLEQAARQTAYPHMIRDASRYVPALRQAEYRGSLWEVWLVRCDGNQLENALLNLAINARDAMPDGGAVTVDTTNIVLDAPQARRRDMPPGEYVRLRVSDTGVGMPPSVKARAFDPFYTTKPMGKGTGLGLSMIYGFVRQSDGSVLIDSEIGKGTSVEICLPRYKEGPVEAPVQESSGDNRAEANEVVLIVEDEAVVRLLVVETLNDLGYKALETADSVAALRILQSSQRVDLLVSDIGLPGLNGRQLADAARVTRPGLKVLFVTGYAEDAAGNAFLEPGMEIVIKPFTMEALASKIREVIEDPR